LECIPDLVGLRKIQGGIFGHTPVGRILTSAYFRSAKKKIQNFQKPFMPIERAPKNNQK
jgi:hypothetical protein